VAGRVLKLYLLTLPILLVVDLLWIGMVAKGFYRRQLGDLLRPDVRLGPALLFYALYAAALLVFAVWPAIARQSLGRAAVLGGLLGLVAYSTYDLTNLAILRNFSVAMAAVDMAWGAVVSVLVAVAAFRLAGWVR
jgi:uncharacterized membrane protein